MPSISLKLLTTEDLRIELGEVSQLAVSLTSSEIPEASTLNYYAILQYYTSSEQLLNTNVNISSDPYTVNFDVHIGIPTFSLSEETLKSNDWNVNISAYSYVDKNFIYDEMNKNIVVPVSVDQLLTSPDIFSVSTFSAEQIIELGKYIQETTSDLAIKAVTDEALEFAYLPTLDARREPIWGPYHEDPTKPWLFEFSLPLDHIISVDQQMLDNISEGYKTFQHSESVQTVLGQENFLFESGFKLENDQLLNWNWYSSQATFFDDTNNIEVTFKIVEDGYEVNLADAVKTDDDNLLLLVSGSDGVGGSHYFAKLYDLTGTHQKTVLLSSNGYDGSIIKLNNDQYGMIIDTTLQVMSSDLSSFSIPIDLNIDAWSTTRPQQFSEQLIRVAKFNGGDNWSNELLWINTELTDSNDIYFGDQAGAKISTLGGADRIYGGIGDDLINGGQGPDIIHATDGNDILIGEEGDDTLVGGSGNDTFKFVKIDSGSLGHDRVLDFLKTEDAIETTGYITIKKTLDAFGHDLFIFDEDNGESSVTIENTEIASTLTLQNLINATVNISNSNAVIDAGGGIDVAEEVTFSELKINEIDSFKSSLKIKTDTVVTDPINLSDVLVQLKHIIGLKRLKASALEAGDCNNDGIIDLSDVLANLKHIIGLKEIDTFDLVTNNGFAINALSPESAGTLTLVINGDADQSHADWELI